VLEASGEERCALVLRVFEDIVGVVCRLFCHGVAGGREVGEDAREDRNEGVVDVLVDYDAFGGEAELAMVGDG